MTGDVLPKPVVCTVSAIKGPHPSHGIANRVVGWQGVLFMHLNLTMEIRVPESCGSQLSVQPWVRIALPVA